MQTYSTETASVTRIIKNSPFENGETVVAFINMPEVEAFYQQRDILAKETAPTNPISIRLLLRELRQKQAQASGKDAERLAGAVGRLQHAIDYDLKKDDKLWVQRTENKPAVVK